MDALSSADVVRAIAAKCEAEKRMADTLARLDRSERRLAVSAELARKSQILVNNSLEYLAARDLKDLYGILAGSDARR